MNGTFATSGSPRQAAAGKRVIAATPSIIPSSMQMSITLAPFSTCWRAMAKPLLRTVSFLHQLRKLRRPGNVRPLPNHHESCPSCCVNGCDPESRSGLVSTNSLIGPHSSCSESHAVPDPSSAFAIAAICSGVFPQQPPGNVDQSIASRKAARETAPYPPAQDQSPVGSQWIRQPRIRISRTPPHPPSLQAPLKNGYIRSGPSEQFRPTESGFTCFTAFQKASVVCAEINVSPPRPDGGGNHHRQLERRPRSNTSRIATSAAFAFNESKIVSTSSRSDSTCHQRPHLLLVSRRHLVERHHAKSLRHPHRASSKATPSAAQSPPPQTVAAPSHSPTRSAHRPALPGRSPGSRHQPKPDQELVSSTITRW